MYEVSFEIKHNIHPMKATGFDLITGEIKIISTERHNKTKASDKCCMTNKANKIWKVAEVILIPKLGKIPQKASS